MTAVISVIGKGLLAGALGDLYIFLKSSTYRRQLQDVLKELNIQAELDIVAAILQDIQNTPADRHAVDVASEQVKSTITDIHSELREIQNELEHHKTRFFHYFRTPNYEEQIKKLKILRRILQERRELLISVLGIQWNKIKNL